MDPAHDAKALRAKSYGCFILAGLLVCSAVMFSGGGWTDAIAQETVRFAVIGDYGFVGAPEADVAALVISWATDFIITTGDNNYEFGEARTIDINIGQFYHDYISPYFGNFGAGSPSGNRFFPSLGNHDWESPNAQPYLDYFQLPGNERYYTFRRGPVHFFVLDSDPREPDGVTSNSAQAQWLRDGLQASTAPWKLVYFHHPPYSSGSTHGSHPYMQWPFQAWGASAVLTGHEHNYERLIINNFPYFVVGLSGRSIYAVGAPISGSVVRYNADYGAMLVDATSSAITFSFYSRLGTLVDSYTRAIAVQTTLSASPTSVAAGGTVTATWAGIASPTTTDWIGLYTPGAANTAYIHWIYVSCSQSAGAAQASGSCPFVVPSTVAPGTYQLRLLANDGFTVVLATSNNFTVSAGSGAGSLQFNSATFTVAENVTGGNATITVTRTGGSAGAVGVTFATSNGTATAGQDYTATSQTVTFANGDTANKTVSIPIVDDTSVEPNETVNLTLSNPTGGATLGSPNTAALTITDNDGGTTLSASPTTVAPGGTITATWSGIATPAARDWIGLYTPGAANTAYIHWIYVSCSQSAGAAQASGSCPFVVPSTVAPGTYQLRLLANDGFTVVLATSNSFTVQ